MSEMIPIEEEQERVILIGVCGTDEREVKASMEELGELVHTAGAEVAGIMLQKRETIHNGTYFGTGKLLELWEYLQETDATGIVCDDELSPSQVRNMEEILQTKIMDRTLVILDIFAMRARTKEGKIQVELAQLAYRLSRLAGQGGSLSRLGGGIGTRGPGEKKLEVDRRLIKNRMAHLRHELEEIESHRMQTRRMREKNPIKVAAIVGYTNAGKSTIMNRLTGANVYEADALFATLDPTTRPLLLPGGQKLLLTDTVGFIRKLPHHLINAFRSTLEEAKYADFIIHVVDVSNPEAESQMETVYETLDQLNVSGKKVITLFNKMDLIGDARKDDRAFFCDKRADQMVRISAVTGEGIHELTDALEAVLREEKCYLECVIPYDQMGVIARIRSYGELLSEEYREEGICIRAFMPEELYAACEKFCR